MQFPDMPELQFLILRFGQFIQKTHLDCVSNEFGMYFQCFFIWVVSEWIQKCEEDCLSMSFSFPSGIILLPKKNGEFNEILSEKMCSFQLRGISVYSISSGLFVRLPQCP